MPSLRDIGVDMAFISSFLLVNLISATAANSAITRLHQLFLGVVREQGDQETLATVRDERAKVLEQLELKIGGVIGTIERFLYIYAFMAPQASHFGLLTGVVILKAFFGWIRQAAPADPMQDDELTNRKTFQIYSTYIFGNCLSLVAALLLGGLGNVLARLLSFWFFGSVKPA